MAKAYKVGKYTITKSGQNTIVISNVKGKATDYLPYIYGGRISILSLKAISSTKWQLTINSLQGAGSGYYALVKKINPTVGTPLTSIGVKKISADTYTSATINGKFTLSKCLVNLPAANNFTTGSVTDTSATVDVWGGGVFTVNCRYIALSNSYLPSIPLL